MKNMTILFLVSPVLYPKMPRPLEIPSWLGDVMVMALGLLSTSLVMLVIHEWPGKRLVGAD